MGIRYFIIIAGLCFLPHFVWAAGAILVDSSSTGEPVGWGIPSGNGVLQNTINYNPETTSGTTQVGGTLGRLSNAETLELLEELFSGWSVVTLNDGSSDINIIELTITQGEGLGNVDEDNIDDHFTYCPSGQYCSSTDEDPFVLGSARSGQSPIIFDEDGSIVDLIQGEGANQSVLGFAGPRVVQRIGSVLFITEAQAVLNGLFIDCPDGAASNDACQDPEVSIDAFKGAIFHELGHFLGLDHTQVNLDLVTNAAGGDEVALAGIPTMFPLFVDGEAQLSLHYDDKIAMGLLYGNTSFANRFCTIQGTVFESDGTTPMQGVNVVARRVENGVVEATSFVSGAHYTGSSSNCSAANGDYVIQGLVPGVSYTLEVERISSVFTGGSSIEPCDPPASGFDEAILEGRFSCDTGGQVIATGTAVTTDIVTTKNASSSGSGQSSGGCSLIPIDR